MVVNVIDRIYLSVLRLDEKGRYDEGVEYIATLRRECHVYSP